MSSITSLEPRIVWEQFDAITQVPRPSKKEGRIIDFLVAFAERHGIEYRKDATGNVVMRKPATRASRTVRRSSSVAHGHGLRE
ncbi:aminoacyl-histidine dipeptidase, partial [human gut metagenome]